MATPNRLATITTLKKPLTPNQKMGNTLKNINKTVAKNKLVDQFKGMSAAEIKAAYKKMSQADKKKYGMAMFKANQANKKSIQSSQSTASKSTPDSTKAPKSRFQGVQAASQQSMNARPNKGSGRDGKFGKGTTGSGRPSEGEYKVERGIRYIFKQGKWRPARRGPKGNRAQRG